MCHPLRIRSFALVQTVNDDAQDIHEGSGCKPQGPVQHAVMVLQRQMLLPLGSQFHFFYCRDVLLVQGHPEIKTYVAILVLRCLPECQKLRPRGGPAAEES